MLRLQTADNCLMCGRCAEKCPVGIDLNTLRVNSRDKMHNVPDERRYGYFKGLDRSEGAGKVGYFAGCMTLLTPRTMSAMSAIFEAAGEEVWWADREGGVCCGRPLKLAGETDSARKMMKYNADLFRKHGITTLVTSCPICLKVFREDYDLPGIEILHHSEYILRPRLDARERPLLRLFGGQYGHLRRPAGADRPVGRRAARRHGGRGDRHRLPALQKGHRPRHEERGARSGGDRGCSHKIIRSSNRLTNSVQRV